MGDFLCVGLLADYLLIRLHGVVVLEYETIFNTKYFIINGKTTALCSQNRSAVLTYIATQVVVYWRVKMTFTYKHPHPPLFPRAQTHIHLGVLLFLAFPGALPFIHRQVAIYWRLVDDNRHTPISMPTLDCLPKHTFLFHAYRSVSFTHMQHYTQLAYLFHQCRTGLRSRDDRTADCTVKHPGVERPFSSN